MNTMLIKILGVIIAIIVILLVVALFVKKKYTLAREIIIKSRLEDVYDYLRFHKNQRYHNHWLRLDPNAIIEINSVYGI